MSEQELKMMTNYEYIRDEYESGPWAWIPVMEDLPCGHTEFVPCTLSNADCLKPRLPEGFPEPPVGTYCYGTEKRGGIPLGHGPIAAKCAFRAWILFDGEWSFSEGSSGRSILAEASHILDGNDKGVDNE